MNQLNSLQEVSPRNEPEKRRSFQLGRWLAITIVLLILVFAGTREFWFRAIGNSLVYPASLGASDAILIENVDVDYLLFERAQQLEAQGLSKLVLVPVFRPENSDRPGPVHLGFTNVLCNLSRLRDCTKFAVPEQEPISLNVAVTSAHELQKRGLHSVILVTEGFRSRRAAAIYLHVMKPLGITVYLQPVFGRRNPENWFRSGHGFQEIGEQFVKLWYYRLAVL